MFGNSLCDKQTRTMTPLSASSAGPKMNELDRTTQSPVQPSSPRLSSHGERVDEDHGGGYSTRMEELFDGDEHEHGGESGDEEEDFVYDGVDAEQVTGTNYREHLLDVLGPDDSSDVFEEAEVEHSLLKEDPSEKFGEVDAGEPSVSITYCLVLMGCG